uniref:Secreted protein n=1 Tax=Arundo donax TaxID=35708 RepID=A0A0A8ZMU0_ARUDO
MGWWCRRMEMCWSGACIRHICFSVTARVSSLSEKFCWDRVSPSPSGHWFRESLVWHEFLERQDGGRVRWPRFLRSYLAATLKNKAIA